jgi:CYTH domain-containing protein
LIDDILPYRLEYFSKKKIEIGYISSNPLISVRSESNSFDEEFYFCFDDGKVETEKSLPSLNYDFFINNALIPDTNLIEKDEYYFPYEDSKSSNIYIYRGELEGLKIIELEFEDEEQLENFSKPFWFKSELDENIDDYALSYFSKEDIKQLVLTK